jgi:cell wall-associated NlpC family hydrolase
MMVTLIRLLIAIVFAVAIAEPASAAEQSLGEAIRKIFATPTPTPRPRKKKTTTTTKKSPTPTPTPKKTATPRETESPATSVSHSPKKNKIPTEAEESPSPTPKKKKTPTEETPTPSPKKKKSSPAPTPTASPHHKKKTSLSPQPFETPENSPSATPTPVATETPQPSSTPTASEKHRAPNATVSPDQIKGFDNYPEKVKKLLTSALELTTRGLTYKYGSADPENGGMDCSGFVYFVLKANGIGDAPRDSTEQYNWLRRAHGFEAVLSERDDTYELNDLRPGDLLFWTGTYSVERDPPITHTMIYLGREKKTNNRIMVGSSDGRVYQGESRNGVSVFDFNVHRSKGNLAGNLRPVFVGYAHIPGMQE